MINVRKIILEEARAESGVPFAWGTADCLCFAAQVAQRMLGRDPIAHLRGRYDSEIGCRRAMVEEGWTAWRDAPASLFAPVPVAQARAGDWALVTGDDGTDAIGVVLDSRIVVKGLSGIVQLPLSRASEAFRVA